MAFPGIHSECTDIGRNFFLLLNRHFPKHHNLHKFFIQSNVKVSYSSLLNFSSIINSHNKKILNDKRKRLANVTFNCSSKSCCAFAGNCLLKSIIFIATKQPLQILRKMFHIILGSQRIFLKTLQA